MSVAAASAAAIGAHGRQAGAAVAAMAAAGVQAQTQQASAMAAQAAMFLEFQVRRGVVVVLGVLMLVLQAVGDVRENVGLGGCTCVGA